MKQIFIADSSALFSLFIDTDANYKEAIKISERYLKGEGIAIVPSEVFSELINILGKKFDHITAVKAITVLLESETFIIENTLDSTRNNGIRKFKFQPKSVSFTDCIVMAMADFYETKEIFGFDEGFKKNGYTRIGIDKPKR